MIIVQLWKHLRGLLINMDCYFLGEEQLIELLGLGIRWLEKQLKLLMQAHKFVTLCSLKLLKKLSALMDTPSIR